MVVTFRGRIRLVSKDVVAFAMLHFDDGHDQPHEACDEDGSGSMTYDEMLGVFRKFGTSATLSHFSCCVIWFERGRTWGDLTAKQPTTI